MNRKILAGLIALFATTGATAQSGVTMYGVIDTAVRYTTNQVNTNGTVGSQTALTEGAFQGPRIGIKGEENVGGGTAAVFKLEAGFQSNNGVFDQQGQLFGRQEFVGLKDASWGELDAGRQYSVAFDLLGNYDPLNIGNFNENEWTSYVYGVRFDNTLKYANTWGPVTAKAQYSIGGQAGQTPIGATPALSLAYTEGPFSIGGVYQQSTDQHANKMRVAGMGSSIVVGRAILYLQYFDAKRDPYFAQAAPNSGGALANTSLLSNAGNTLQRKDSVWTAGTLFQVAPAVGCTFGYMYDAVKNESSLGDNGRISTVYAIADYHLSKRTDVYVDFDRTILGGGEIGDANAMMEFAGAPLGGNTTRNGAAIGLRLQFF